MALIVEPRYNRSACFHYLRGAGGSRRRVSSIFAVFNIYCRYGTLMVTDVLA
jgi:hypothetical protein